MGQRADATTIFIVDDDAAVRDSLAMLVELSGFRVESFACATDFLAAYDPPRPGCLILDVRLPDMSGPELHELLVRKGVHVPTIFLTGHAPLRESPESRRRGVVAVFEKPCPAEELIDVIRKATAGVSGV
jgi:FixJ family two-component response regulator